MTDVPVNSIHSKTRAEWRTWLEQHHTRNEGVWLIRYKKGTGKPRFDYDETVEEALCFGWIDSKPNKLDDERSLLWFAPRKPRTGWSKLNKERVERLSKQGGKGGSGETGWFLDCARCDRGTGNPAGLRASIDCPWKGTAEL